MAPALAGQQPTYRAPEEPRLSDGADRHADARPLLAVGMTGPPNHPYAGTRQRTADRATTAMTAATQNNAPFVLCPAWVRRG